MQETEVISPEILKPAERLIAISRSIFGEALLGFYLHGSGASGALEPQSDVDFLMVLTRGLQETERRTLVAQLLEISGPYPRSPEGPRCLEVLIVTASQLASPAYPARAELLYGEWLRDALLGGADAPAFADAVTTLMLAQARGEAQAILGPPFTELAGRISGEQVKQAMRDSLPTLIEGLRGDERNVILTLARMWRTTEVGDFVSKSKAAEWAATRLPTDIKTIVVDAAKAYRGEIADVWQDRESDVRRAVQYLRAQLHSDLSIGR